MENNQEIKKALSISAPSFYTISDSVANIKRINKLEIDWSDIDKNFNKNAYLKEFFLDNTFNNISGETLLRDSKGKLWDILEYKDYQHDTPPKKILVFILRPSMRFYALLTDGMLFEETNINDFLDKDFDSFWDGIKNRHLTLKLLIVDNGVAGSTVFPRSEYISRELLFYNEKFKHLSAKLKFIQQIIAKIDGEFTTNVIASEDKLSKLFSDSELLDLHLQNYSRIKHIEININKEIETIKNKLKENGYILETDGKIYELYEKTESYEEDGTEVVIERDSVKVFPRGEKTGAYEIVDGPPRKVTRNIKTIKYRKVETPREVSLSQDLIYNKIIEYKSSGKYFVHIFENRNGEFVPNGDKTLSEVLQLCNDLENVRQQTIVVVKEFESIDSINKEVIGATFYLHPMSEILPSRFPVIAFKERLDYRMSWDGLEVGKLLNSISLAPGETKNISVNNKYFTSISNSTSNKSFNEVNTSSSSEVVTEFEKLVTNELEKTSETSSSLSAGASYGGLVSASGSTTQRKKETIKDFTKNLNKVTNRASNSINRRVSLEVNSSSSFTSESSSDTSQTSAISNINQGRALNLYYYQINNRYKTRTYLENIEIELGSSRELIINSGIYETFTFRLTRIDEVLNYVKAFLPNPLVTLAPEDLDKKIIESLKNKLNEYTDTPLGIEDEIVKRITKSESVNALKLDKEIVEKFNKNLDADNQIINIKLLLSSLNFDNAYFNEESLLIDSGSFYLDSQVGINPATEDYSEKMRELEALKVSAEIENQKALTDNIKQKNQFLSSNKLFITSIANYTKKILSEAEPKLTILNFSLLNLSNKTIDKTWQPYLSNVAIKNCKLKLNTEGNIITLEWAGEMPTTEALKSELVLLNDENETLKFI